MQRCPYFGTKFHLIKGSKVQECWEICQHEQRPVRDVHLSASQNSRVQHEHPAVSQRRRILQSKNSTHTFTASVPAHFCMTRSQTAHWLGDSPLAAFCLRSVKVLCCQDSAPHRPEPGPDSPDSTKSQNPPTAPNLTFSYGATSSDISQEHGFPIYFCGTTAHQKCVSRQRFCFQRSKFDLPWNRIFFLISQSKTSRCFGLQALNICLTFITNASVSQRDKS